MSDAELCTTCNQVHHEARRCDSDTLISINESLRAEIDEATTLTHVMLGHIEEAHKLLDRITGVKQEPDVGLVLRLEQFDTTYQARPPEGVLKRVQRELVPWVKHNFGDRPGWMPVMGIQEECGELAHAFLKRAQGIRGTDEQHLADIRDALADIIIFACDAATAHGIDLEQALSDTWAMVKQRDFIKDVADGGGHRHD